jgi:hypothetical protein
MNQLSRAALIVVLAAVPAFARSQQPIVATSPGLFEFHSGMWLNLHHFLYTLSRARLGLDGGRSATTSSLGDTVGLGARGQGERAAFERAITYYTDSLAARNAVFDSLMVEIKNQLAELERVQTVRGSKLSPQLVDALESAAPLYRSLWWTRHDSLNRRWVASMLPLLAQHGRVIGNDVAAAYDARWPLAPIRVDVSAYTNWSGAYTTEHPSHVMFSSTVEGDQGTSGLELLFHESSHTMEDELEAARRQAGTAAKKRAPRDLTHAIIFYTAGEMTRRKVLGHVPYAEAEGLWQRSPFGAFLPLIQRHWQLHLDGRTTLREAIRAIVDAL